MLNKMPVRQKKLKNSYFMVDSAKKLCILQGIALCLNEG
jgi:hypothetical protein